ncbi:FK506 binding protein [Aureococcus anophagefferens]|nr:FK506 binding protein [Aureococcus anophagefferens]
MSERRNDSVDAPMLGALFGAESSSGSESDDESSGFAPPPAAPWHADADDAEPPPRSDAGDPQRDAETALVAGGASARAAAAGADLACKGGVCWGAARALCALFAANPARADLAGRRILELGAGTGAVGLWIARGTRRG